MINSAMNTTIMNAVPLAITSTERVQSVHSSSDMYLLYWT